MEHKNKAMNCNLLLPSQLSFFAKGSFSCTGFKKKQTNKTNKQMVGRDSNSISVFLSFVAVKQNT